MAASLLCVAARREHSNHLIVSITFWNILTISPRASAHQKKKAYRLSVEAEGKNSAKEPWVSTLCMKMPYRHYSCVHAL